MTNIRIDQYTNRPMEHKKFIPSFVYWTMCLFVYLSIPLDLAFAAITNPVLKSDLGSGEPANIFGRFLSTWWGVAYVAAGIIFFLYVVWGSIEWSIAGSNKDRVENAKNKIQNAFFGLALLTVSFALIKAIGYVLGIDILENLTFDVGKLAP